MSIEVDMPSGAHERVEPNEVFVLRRTTDIEKDEAPEALSCIWGGSFRIYPAEPILSLTQKFSVLKLARLTSPGGMPLFVNADVVTKRDKASPIQDDKKTRSVLCFGPGAAAARVRIRETDEDLRDIWGKLGVPADIFDK